MRFSGIFKILAVIALVFVGIGAIYFYWLFFTKTGKSTFAHRLGKSMMAGFNSTVEDGYFIDRNHSIKFKLPPGAYVAELYGGTYPGAPAHANLRYENWDVANGDAAFTHLVYYEKVSSTESQNPIQADIELEISKFEPAKPGMDKFLSTMTKMFAKNHKVVAKEVTKDRGFLIYTFDDPSAHRRRKLKIKYAIKDNFMVWCYFTGFIEKFDDQTSDKTFEDLIASFSAQPSAI